MKIVNRKRLGVSVTLLAAFLLWTAAVCTIEVRAIGPQESRVGFAALNGFVHALTGIHMALYVITDWLSIVPVCIALGFASLGLVQWMRRKSLWKVDRSILALGGFYAAVLASYALFEGVVINYRPVLIEGRLEASYPSSTTMLVLCVMPTAMMQLRRRIKRSVLCRCVLGAMAAFSVLMVFLRLFSGVHWATDIIGGVLLSSGLVVLYAATCGDE